VDNFKHKGLGLFPVRIECQKSVNAGGNHIQRYLYRIDVLVSFGRARHAKNLRVGVVVTLLPLALVSTL
jgi:hypothetical protein